MLRIFREGQRWLTGLFVLTIGGVFVFFIGLGAPLQRSTTAVVEVGDQSYDFRDFARIREQRENYFREQLGDQYDPRAMKDTLDQVAIQALIEQSILSQEAEALGLTVTKAEIERMILDAAIFRGADGRFDQKEYEDWAEYNYGTQRNFIREQRTQMLGNKLIRLLRRAAQVSEGEARQAVVQRLEEAELAFVSFDPSTAPTGFAASPEDVQAFLAERSAEARALYDARSGIYDVPEQVRARHILFAVKRDASEEVKEQIRAKAEAVRQKILAGEEFEVLAVEYSDDPGSKNKGGDLGFFGRGQMVKEFEDAAFGGEEGAVLELVQTSFGYHIIRVEEHREAQVRTFDEVKEELAAELLEKEAGAKLQREAAESFAEAIRGGQSLEEAARDADKYVHRVTTMRRPDGFIEGLGAAQDLMAAVFAMKPGQTSDRIYSVGDKLAFVQLVDRKVPDERAVAAAIDSERERLESARRNAYVTAWINQRRSELAAAGNLIVNLDRIDGS